MDIPISTVSFIGGPAKKLLDELRADVSGKFQTKEALKWKPHLTIAPKVLIPKEKIELTTKKLELLCKSFTSFIVETNQIQFTEINISTANRTPYVINILLRSNSSLEKLNQSVQYNIYKNFEFPGGRTPYVPHITVAYRDLTKENWEKAKDYFKNYSFKTTLEINNLNLIYDNSNIIKPYRDFILPKTNVG